MSRSRFTPSGLMDEGLQQWDQGTPSIPDDPENVDYFGGSVAAGNYGIGASDDLAIGVPFEDSGSQQHQIDTGAIHIIYGFRSGLVSRGTKFIALPGRLITTNDEVGFSLSGPQDLSH